MKNNESINVIRGLIFGALLLYGGFKLLCLFDRKDKDNSPRIEYYVASTTINGRFYQQETSPEALYSDFITFEDGTRVPCNLVKFTKRTISVEELKAGNEALTKALAIPQK